MTENQEAAIMAQVNAAMEAGQMEKVIELVKTMPLSLSVAEVTKDALGIDFLLDNGFDLSEAVAEHGQEWLTS